MALPISISDLSDSVQTLTDNDLVLVSKYNSVNNYTSAKMLAKDLKKSVKSNIEPSDLPKASKNSLGAIKVGNGLSIESDGTLNSTGSSITVDSVISTTSVNPVQNKVIASALDQKASTLEATKTRSGLMSSEDKTKLDDITDASKTSKGLVKVGSNINVNLGTISLTNQNVIDALGYIPGSSSGNVSGPSESVADRIATFSDTTGKVIKDSGFTIAKSVPEDAKFTDTTYSVCNEEYNGLMSSTDKIKLNRISENAEENQNTFTNINIVSGGKTDTISAISKTDTLIISSGSNISIEPISATNEIIISSVGNGNVSGPDECLGDHIATFSDTTGKIIKDSGFTIAASVPENAKFTDTTYDPVTTEKDGLMTISDKTKLDGIATGAEVNQNSFSFVKVDSERIDADEKQSQVSFISGSNIVLSTDKASKSITISSNNDGNVTGPTFSTIDRIATFSDATGKSIKDSGFTIEKSVPSDAKFTDTTYDAATTSSDGLLSATDKLKLDGIASGATKITVDTALSSTSTNPVQNKVINDALASKASTSTATTSAAGLMSTADKTKLDQLSVITIDDALSSTSTNPLQNKVVNEALSSKASTDIATTSSAGLMSAADKTKLNNITVTQTTVSDGTTTTLPIPNIIVTATLPEDAYLHPDTYYLVIEEA